MACNAPIQEATQILKLKQVQMCINSLPASVCAQILFKEIGPRSGVQNVRPDLFDTQMVFLKEFLEKVDFEKIIRRPKQNNNEIFPRGQRVQMGMTISKMFIWELYCQMYG